MCICGHYETAHKSFLNICKFDCISKPLNTTAFVGTFDRFLPPQIYSRGDYFVAEREESYRIMEMFPNTVKTCTFCLPHSLYFYTCIYLDLNSCLFL